MGRTILLIAALSLYVCAAHSTVSNPLHDSLKSLGCESLSNKERGVDCSEVLGTSIDSARHVMQLGDHVTDDTYGCAYPLSVLGPCQRGSLQVLVAGYKYCMNAAECLSSVQQASSQNM